MKLIEFKASPNCMRVRMAAALKQISYTTIEIDPLDRQEVVKVSGQRTVPVLVDGKKILHDSMTIIRYLEKKFPDPVLFPRGGKAEAETEILVDWGNEVFRSSVFWMFQEALKKKSDRDRKKIRQLGKTYHFHLRLLEKWLSSGKLYLTGETLSAADICIYPFVTYAVLPEKLKGHIFYGLHYRYLSMPKGLHHLQKWMGRMAEISDLKTR